MINSTYGDVSLVPQLHQQLEALFTREGGGGGGLQLIR